MMSSDGRDESGIIMCPATQITSQDHCNSSPLRTGHNLHYSIKYRVYLSVRAPSAKVSKILFKSIKCRVKVMVVAPNEIKDVPLHSQLERYK